MLSKLDGQAQTATAEPGADSQATLAELGPDRYQLQGVLDLGAVAGLAKHRASTHSFKYRNRNVRRDKAQSFSRNYTCPDDVVN